MIANKRLMELFVDILGHPEDFETEWSIFEDWFQEEKPTDEGEVKDFLDDLADQIEDDAEVQPNRDGMDGDSDEDDKKKKALQTAVFLAKRLLK